MNDSMKPSEIDKDGVWSRNGEEIAILGSLFLVTSITTKDEKSPSSEPDAVSTPIV